MNKRATWLLSSAACMLLLHCAAPASDTTTYTYDALGRLVGVSTTGGPNNGVAVTTGYDPAGNRANYTVAGASAQPSFAISDVSATEGGTLTFTVTKSGAATGSFSVNYATANGTATAPSDYTAASGTLTFAQTDTTKTISVTTINDTATESTETLLVNLSGATGGSTITDPQGSGSILDNDAGNQPPVAVADTGSMTWCAGKSFNVLANDSDPDGNLPLALVSVSGGGTRGTPSIVNNQVWFEPSGITGTANVSYTMRDSLNATASTTLTITIGNGSCGSPQAPPAAPQSSDDEGGS